MRPRLLWVSQNRILGKLSKEYFETRGYEVEAVDRAMDFLLLIPAFQPDVLAVDVEMTWQRRPILESLVEHDAFYDIPVVIAIENLPANPCTHMVNGREETLFPKNSTEFLGIISRIIAEPGAPIFHSILASRKHEWNVTRPVSSRNPPHHLHDWSDNLPNEIQHNQIINSVCTTSER